MEHVEHTHESNIRRMDAEIGKLLAETARITDERRKMDAEIAKLAKETSWHPMTAIAAAVGATATIIGATAAITKLFFT